MSILDEIKPKEHQRVIDLVRLAGIDVADWSNYKNGEANPAANPKYCYEWAFVEPGKLVILNLWYDNMREINEQIEQRLNFLESAWHETNSIRKSRRDRMREAVILAYRDKLPIRVIVLDGQHQKDATPDKPNRPSARFLDPIPWAVVNFDETTGDYLFRRGAPPSPYVDQFSLPLTPEGDFGKHEVHGTAYNRSAEVRRYVLSRAKGKCEFCSIKGFTLADGSTYLETHHVIPLAEGGKDSPSNVAALCPNHHKEAHYGQAAAKIRDYLLDYISSH